MAIAVISDIHGNLEALEAVFAKIEQEKIPKSNIICLGDIVGYGPDPQECIKAVLSRIPRENIVLGNHELKLMSAEDEERVQYNSFAILSHKWAKKQVSAEQIQALSEIYSKQPQFELIREEMLFVHGKPSEDKRERMHGRLEKKRISKIFETKGDDDDTRFDDEFRYLYKKICAECQGQEQKRDTAFCFFGHTHNFWARIEPTDAYSPPKAGTQRFFVIEVRNQCSSKEVQEMQRFPVMNEMLALINVPAIGMPRDRDPRAKFIIADRCKQGVLITLVCVPYDLMKTMDKIYEHVNENPAMVRKLMRYIYCEELPAKYSGSQSGRHSNLVPVS